eukprot:scaffold69444_cov22-Tisochrysis_lutea.AAC.1
MEKGGCPDQISFPTSLPGPVVVPKSLPKAHSRLSQVAPVFVLSHDMYGSPCNAHAMPTQCPSKPGHAATSTAPHM